MGSGLSSFVVATRHDCLGEGAFFKTAAGSRNQISLRPFSARVHADGGVSRFRAAEE